MKFEVEAPDGRIFEIEGDRMPTEAELNDIYSSYKAEPLDASKFNGRDLRVSDGSNQQTVQKADGLFNSILQQGIDFGKSVKDTYGKTDGFSDVLERTKELAGETDYSEVGKAFARGGLEIAKSSVGDGMRMIGDFLRYDGDTSKMSVNEKIDNAMINGAADLITKAGEAFNKIADLGLDSEFLKEDLESLDKGFTKPASVLAGASSSLVAAFGMAKATKSTILPAIMLSSAEGNPIYFEAKEEGENKLKSLSLSLAATGGGALLENVGLKSTSKGIVKAVLNEGLTEASQGVWNNMIRHYGYDDTVDIYEGVVLNAMVGGIVGGGVSILDSGLGFVSNLRDKGLKDSDIESINDVVISEVAKSGNAIDTYLQDNMKRNLSTLESIVDQSIDPIEQQKKIETTEQLQKVYDDSYNKFKEFMPDLEAKSNAAVVRSQALYFAEANNTTVKDYVENIAPKVKNVKFEEFKQDAQMQEVQGKADITTPEFKEWFGDSKVVDENGEPLVVYHGTNAKFEVFDKNKLGMTTESESAEKGFFFSKSEETAQTYANYAYSVQDIKDLEKKQREAEKNDDWDLAEELENEITKLRDEAIDVERSAKFGVVQAVYLDIKNAEVFDAEDLTWGQIGEEVNNVIDRARGNKKDGVIIKNLKDDAVADVASQISTDHFVVFNPNQIKSVYNKGIFSKDSDNIYMQNERSPRGAFANDTIYMFENRNSTTFIHEMGHSWKSQLEQLSETHKQSAELLGSLNEFTSKEFSRKYKVEKDGDSYVVVDKKGRIIYNRSGKGFETSDKARDYAENEIFAQSAEKYFETGKSPNNSLKQVFRNFLIWIKNAYKSIGGLDIKLDPEITSLFDTILGGKEIDEFIDANVDDFIAKRYSTEEQKAEELEKVKTFTENSKKQKTTGKGLRDIWEVAMIPITTQLSRISKDLKYKVREYEFGLAKELKERMRMTNPFLEKWNKFEETDAKVFDYALKNRYTDTVNSIVEKYGAEKEWADVKSMLEGIYDDSINYGLEVGYLADYFPRKVEDVEGFMSYMYNMDSWTFLEQKLKEVDPENTFTQDEKAEFFNKHLKGFLRIDKSILKYGSEKGREIERITNDLNQFYAPSMQSLLSYIEGMNTRINNARLLGNNAENIEESLGYYMAYLTGNNIIDMKDAQEVRDLLYARLNQRGVSNKGLRGLKNISYAYLMGGVNSAITQIEDLSVSMYKAGVWNTLSSMVGKKAVTREDLGLEYIAEEFRDSEKTGKMVNTLFKITGLDRIDKLGKETLANAVLKKWSKDVDKPYLKEYAESILGERAEDALIDIKEGRNSDDVVFLLYNELSDVQPISLSELPPFYNTSGNMRVLYMLKSFMVKRIDIFRNEVFDKIRTGDRKQQIEGVQNLFKLALLMVVMGASKDFIINLLYGRDIDPSEIVINNAINLTGVSKYQIYRARQEGIGGTIKNMVAPPLTALFDDAIGDVGAISSGNRDLHQAEVLKGIPVIGRLYYWHLGRGKQKLENRKKKSY